MPSKNRVFPRRLAQQPIPSTDLLHHHCMAVSSNCTLRGAEDSWRHLILECTMSRCVWALAVHDLVETMKQTRDMMPKHWIVSLLESLPHSDFILLLVTLWGSGLYDMLAGKQFQSPNNTHEFMERFLGEIKGPSAPASGEHSPGRCSSMDTPSRG